MSDRTEQITADSVAAVTPQDTKKTTTDPVVGEGVDLHGIERQPFPSFDETCTYLEGVTVSNKEVAVEVIRRDLGYEDETIDPQPIHMRWVEERPERALFFEGPGWYECEPGDPGALPFWKEQS